MKAIIDKSISTKKKLEMHSRLKKLIFSRDLYSFLSVLDSITTEHTPTDMIIRESAKILSMSLYRESYDAGVPQSMMGFCAASQMKKYLPVEDQIQPLTQMLWLAAVEEKKAPYRLEKISVKTGGNMLTRLRSYSDALREKDLKKAYGLFEGFFRGEDERSMLRDFVFGETIKDCNMGGQKYMYFVKGWQLAKLLKWTDVRLMFFPMNHLLATTPKDPQYAELIRVMVPNNETAQWVENTGAVSASEHDALEELVLMGKRDEVISRVAGLMRSGKSPKHVLEALLVAAAQLVADAGSEGWQEAVDAFNYTDSAHYFVHVSKAPEAGLAPLMAAITLNKAARKLDPKRHVDFSEKPYSGDDDPLSRFRYSVIHFDPDSAVACMKAALADESGTAELYRTVLMTASMNDAVICRGRDMQYCYHTLNAYEMTSSPRKEKLMYAMARFLGCINKNYILYKEVWG